MENESGGLDETALECSGIHKQQALLLRPSAVDFEVQNNESLYIYVGPDVS